MAFVPNPTPNSLLFKFNARRHYACPSTHNDFGGYNVRHLILDSGCNSLLLPITSDQDRAQLVALFGNALNYTWTIGVSGNAGPMSTCSLTIRCIGGQFPISLCNTTTPYNLNLPRLRFSISHQDAVALINLHNNGTLVLAGLHDLQTYVASIDALAAAIPGTVVGGRRDYALIGQDLLYGKYIFESGDLAMVCQTQVAAPPQNQHGNYINICQAWILAEFNMAVHEFDFIDDDEHGDPEEIDEFIDE